MDNAHKQSHVYQIDINYRRNIMGVDSIVRNIRWKAEDGEPGFAHTIYDDVLIGFRRSGAQFVAYNRSGIAYPLGQQDSVKFRYAQLAINTALEGLLDPLTLETDEKRRSFSLMSSLNVAANASIHIEHVEEAVRLTSVEKPAVAELVKAFFLEAGAPGDDILVR